MNNVMRLCLQSVRILVVSILCILTGLVMTGTAQETQGTSVAKSYVIGPQDVLEIKVWGHDDLFRSVSVSADGYFSFPLIGRVRAGGLTVRQLEEQITKLLDKDYIVNPQVTITVTEFKSKKVFILGEVLKPGAYYLSKNDTLLEIISKAGGVTQNAGREIIIVRPTVGSRQQPIGLDDPTSEQIRVDLQALIAGDVSKNIGVQDNDTIYVPKSSMFSVFGEVRKPGSYSLEKEMTVLEAISIAGGPTQDADPQKLELLRKEGNEQKKIVLNLRDLLNAKDETKEWLIQDGDVIYQPRAEFFFLLGEVNKPGTYKLEEGMTVTKAISVAGGFTEKASKSKVQIIREQDGKQVSHRAKPNELIQPQDIIEVSKSFF
jgi:polysaccharide export outer membrane protein